MRYTAATSYRLVFYAGHETILTFSTAANIIVEESTTSGTMLTDISTSGQEEIGMIWT